MNDVKDFLNMFIQKKMLIVQYFVHIYIVESR